MPLRVFTTETDGHPAVAFSDELEYVFEVSLARKFARDILAAADHAEQLARIDLEGGE